MITLASYKACNKNSRIGDHLIAWWTPERFFAYKLNGAWRKGYSHVEIIIDGVMYSSSPRDGRVRAERHIYNEEVWHYEQISLSQQQKKALVTFFSGEIGKHYDWAGIAGFVLPFVRQVRSRWFCSEICAAALQHARYAPAAELVPHRTSPVRLTACVRKSNLNNRRSR